MFLGVCICLDALAWFSHHSQTLCYPFDAVGSSLVLNIESDEVSQDGSFTILTALQQYGQLVLFDKY